MNALLETSGFAELGGLPLHPLVVHVVVVAIPVAAVAMVVLAFWGSAARRYGWLVVAALAVSTAASFVAARSGQALADTVGVSATHQLWGSFLPWIATAALVVSLAWWVVVLRTTGQTAGAGSNSGARVAMGAVAALVVLAAGAVTVLVGHSGAESVWGGTFSPSSTPVPIESATSATPTGSTTSSGSETPTTSSITAAEVAQHASAESCWAIIDGNAYDLTTWIQQHPGGSGVIVALCGRDATADFARQHSGDSQPAAALEPFLLGPVSG